MSHIMIVLMYPLYIECLLTLNHTEQMTLIKTTIDIVNNNNAIRIPTAMRGTLGDSLLSTLESTG